MQIDGYVQALREDLVRVAALGDETTARAAELLAVALESSVARRLQEVLGEAALEVSSQLDSGRVEVRIAGGDPELVVVRDQEAEPAAAGDDILDARITLRLPDALKRRVEDAATTGRGLREHLDRPRGRAERARRQAVLRQTAHRLRPQLKGVLMSDLLIRSHTASDAGWIYDDPSGVPDAPLEVSLPQPLRSGVETAAAREGPHAERVAHVARLPQPRTSEPEGGLTMPDHRFDTPRPVELRVTIPAGDIDVETVDGDESVITIEGDEKLVEQTTVEQRGDTIVVDFHGKRGFFGVNISIGDLSFGAGGLTSARRSRTRARLASQARRPTRRSAARSSRWRRRPRRATCASPARSRAPP